MVAVAVAGLLKFKPSFYRQAFELYDDDDGDWPPQRGITLFARSLPSIPLLLKAIPRLSKL